MPARIYFWRRRQLSRYTRASDPRACTLTDAEISALEMQRAARRVSLRIGIHDGPARARDGDLIGHDVNVAARIAGRALAGEILVSGAVRGGAGDLAVRFRPATPLVMPGRTPERLFRVHAMVIRPGMTA